MRVLWFRRDLRTADHPALRAAASPDGHVVPLFVLDRSLLTSPRMSPARLSYLCDALGWLDRELRDRGTRLVVRSGDPRAVVVDVAEQVSAREVHWSADHTPYGTARDRVVTARLARAGIAAHAHPGLLVHEPGSVRTASGTPFRVFTPFHRSWRDQPLEPPTGPPGPLQPPPVAGEPLPTVADLGVRPPRGVQAGGAGPAVRRLDRFLDERSGEYHLARDRLDRPGTSRLSADLHFGCLSPREILDRLDRRQPGPQALAVQLAWRDFYHHVLAAWPEVTRQEFDPTMRSLPWRGEGPDAAAWRAGRTGVPIVDAGMRQLLDEGWMHNRARMITASFLCKHLRIDWRLGEAHFLRHLIDADVANNNGGWQWAAGTGTDAQPYVRMFNPVRQGRRFDPDGVYVRRYVPELAAVPDAWIHVPWELPDDEARRCGFTPGGDYPLPLVDHAQARAEAQRWFAEHRVSRRAR